MAQLVSIVWIILLFAVFYLMIIRPQQQRTRKHRELLNELIVGDEIETIGGIRGKVVSIGPDSLGLEVAANVVITIGKRAVSARKSEPEAIEAP